MQNRMDDGTKSPLERAFELARSGRVHTVKDLKKALLAEGYSVAQLQGAALARQLAATMRAAKGDNA
jgi:hypothetical protein